MSPTSSRTRPTAAAGGSATSARSRRARSRSCWPAARGRPIAEPREEQRALEENLRRAGDGVSRRGLLAAAAGTAGVGAVAAAALPLTALGPSPGVLDQTSRWRDGIRLVDEDG